MSRLYQLWRRMSHYVRRGQFDRELEEEMRFHLEMKAEEHVASGMAPEEARRAARRQFGNETRLREVSREMWGFASMELYFRMYCSAPKLRETASRSPPAHATLGSARTRPYLGPNAVCCGPAYKDQKG